MSAAEQEAARGKAPAGPTPYQPGHQGAHVHPQAAHPHPQPQPQTATYVPGGYPQGAAQQYGEQQGGPGWQ
jgi:hypothetical protein